MPRPKRSTLLLVLVVLALATVPVLVPLLVTRGGAAPVGTQPVELAAPAGVTGPAPSAEPARVPTPAPPSARSLAPTTAAPTTAPTPAPTAAAPPTEPARTPAPTPAPTTAGPSPTPSPVPAPTVVAAGPDLVVDSVGWTPADPAAGSQVTFTATVRNTGTDPTPAATHGVAFLVDGTKVSWSASSSDPLDPGETRTYTADGGPTGATWTAVPGTHELEAWIDDKNRIPETNETDNTTTTTLPVP